MGYSQTFDELYRDYKEATKYALAWLRSTRSNDSSQPRLNSTLYMVQAAKDAAARKLEVPNSVISHLQSAVTGRKKVLVLYRGLSPSEDRQSDHSHAAFVRGVNRDGLEEVLNILMPLKSKQDQQVPSDHPETSSVARSPSNRFDILSEAAVHLEVAESAGGSCKENCESQASRQASLGGSSEDVFLEDDDLGEWIELSLFLREIDAISQKVDTYWKDAARDQLSIPLAAWLTTTALHAVGRMFGRLQHVVGTCDDLIAMWVKHKQKHPSIRFKDIPGFTSNGRCADTFALWRAARILHDCRTLDDYRVISSNAGAPLRPLEVFSSPTIPVPSELLRPGQIEDEEDDLALDKMQESMRQLLVSGRAMSALEASDKDTHISEPLLPLLKMVLPSDKDEPTDVNRSPPPFHLVYGYEMLLSTYKAFLWPDPTPTKQNCRLLALSFAMEVKKEISAAVSAIVACQEAGLDKFQLTFGLFLDDLEDYIREKRFDLYYQSPWTAGCHIVELLTAFRLAGMELCCQTGYVCAVLHLYNALRKLEDPLQKIPLMEDLSRIFMPHLFLGGLPDADFSYHFRKALGQDFSTAIPQSKPRDRADFSPISIRVLREFDLASLSETSLFYYLHNQSYRTTQDFWMRVYKGSSIRTPSKKSVRGVMHAIHANPFHISLDKIKDAAYTEFTGDLPTARVNFFKIFTHCVEFPPQIWRGHRSKRRHQDPRQRSNARFSECWILL